MGLLNWNSIIKFEIYIINFIHNLYNLKHIVPVLKNGI